MRKAVLVLVLVAGCGTKVGLDTKLPVHLEDAPVVIVRLESGGVIDWQKERDEAIVERVEECLPTVLAPLCPGVCEVKVGEEIEPHVVLTVKTGYMASAHFMHGFRVEVVYEIWDRAGLERLARFRYVDEPMSKVMAEEGTDKDEVLTFDSSKTADRFCDDVGIQAAEMAEGS